MSTLIDVVEGISNSLLKYFFDPKEPKIELRPTFSNRIDLGLLHRTANEIVAVDIEVDVTEQYGGELTLVTKKGRRQFLKARPLPADHSYCKVWAGRVKPEMVDRLHLANMSALWHHTQRFVKDSSYSGQNFIHASKFIVALADTNRGRLINLTYTESDGMRRLTAIFASAKGDSHTLIEFLSDNTHWDLSEHNPVSVDAPYVVFSKYDEFGRLSEIVKHRVGNREHLFGEVRIVYHDGDPLAPRETQGLNWSVIPSPLIKLLSLSYITHVTDTICPATGARFYTYDCVTVHKRALSITVRH